MPSITINSNTSEKALDHHSATTTTTFSSDDNHHEMKRDRLTFRDIAQEIVAKEQLKTWKRRKHSSPSEKKSKSVALVGAIMEYLARRRQRRQHQPLINEDRDSITAAESTSLL